MDSSAERRGKGSTGCMVVVVGPSGAGKDTLMAYAARHFADRKEIVFARRVITRDSAAGGEDHDGVCGAQFETMESEGAFAVSWQAHGLCYGIPAETRDIVATGAIVIANGSRSALQLFRKAYASLIVINVTARPDVLAARLEARGRESREDIMKRLARGSLDVRGDYRVVTIDNSDEVETAGNALIAAISTLLTQNSGGLEK